jgi:hypothetical protein
MTEIASENCEVKEWDCEESHCLQNSDGQQEIGGMLESSVRSLLQRLLDHNQ